MKDYNHVKMYISIDYEVKWQLKGNEKYVLATCGTVINLATKSIISKTNKGAKVGYYLDGIFTNKKLMHFERIPIKRQCPFGSMKY